MNFKYTYATKRKNKIWINAFYKEGNITIESVIEIKGKEGKINWINKRINLGKDNFLNTLGIEEDANLIKGAINFSIDKGYIK